MRRAVTLSLATALALYVPLPARGEPAPPTTGSWTQLRPALPAAGAPDLQSGDSLPVENAPAGVVAFSAVRHEGDGALLQLSLELVESGTSATPVVWACPVTTTWTAGARQTWAARPSYDCSRHAIGVVHSDVVSWDVGALGNDVALVPPPADTSVSTVSFAPPDSGALAVAVPSPTPSPHGDSQVVVAAPSSAPAELVADPPTREPSTAQVPGPRLAPAASPPARVVLAGAPADKPDWEWAGRALLALLALLVMVRAASPSPALATPVSLLHRAEEDV